MSSIWTDDDCVEKNHAGMAFMVNGARWFLPRHGIGTSECSHWAHYIPTANAFACYAVKSMREYIYTFAPPIVYTPRKPAAPTNRGFLVPLTWLGITMMPAHESFLGAPIMAMPRGKAGKMAELHFVGTIFARAALGREVNFAEAWQDMKGNDVRLPDGRWVQVKLDRGSERSGNLYVQTHTRTKDTRWIHA